MRNQDGFFGLFFAALPNLEELTAVKATIKAENNSKVSSIQPMCCRELIFTEPKVLVSPLLEERNQLFLITQKTVINCSKFQDLLEKLSIQTDTEPVELTKSLFQFCFSFTMKQKLAPLWNKAGEYLVQDRDFMLEKSKLNAVTLEVNISDKICVGLQAFSLKLTPCKPEHFTASTRVLDGFNTNSGAVINDATISDDLCFVLPSLKKGRIISITHKLPEGSPFTSYEDLRKHWKLMYGYRLPPEENVFYNVRFYYIKGKVFTYPASCIRSSQASVSPRCEHQLIFNSFLKDLAARMPSVCGTPLALTSSPVYPTSSLQQATRANHSNLTRTAPMMNHCKPFTFQEPRVQNSPRLANVSPSAAIMYQPRKASPVCHLRSTPLINQAMTTPSINTSKPTRSSTLPFSFLSSETRYVPRFTSHRMTKSLNINSEQSVCWNANCPASGSQIVPSFSRKKSLAGGKKTNERTFRSGNVLGMGTTPKEAAFASRVRVVDNSAQTQNATLAASSQPSLPRIPGPRMGSTCQSHTLSLQQRRCQNVVSSSIARYINGTNQYCVGGDSSVSSPEWMTRNSSKSLRASESNATPATQNANSSTQVSKCLPQSRPGLVVTRVSPISNQVATSGFTGQGLREKNLSRQLQQEDSSWTDVSWLEQDVSGMGTSAAARRISVHTSGDRSNGLVQLPQDSLLTQFQATCELTSKRKIIDFAPVEPPQKKPRPKPRIQGSIDVRELAANDQLHKVNAVTLADWLKHRGIPVKSKDKKSDLTSKVKQYLALVPHEQ